MRLAVVLSLPVQALLSLPCLAHDLSQFSSSSSTGGGGSSTAAGDTAVVSTRGGNVNSSSSFSQLQLPPDGVTAAMVTCLRQMSACRSVTVGLQQQYGCGDRGCCVCCCSRQLPHKRAVPDQHGCVSCPAASIPAPAHSPIPHCN
jgi:hypothetical protein